ncbi:hypothetical protein [Lysinibacillus sp. NPDC056185]|uniref:hypothetical protein n=1 Tax=Lysinibacillus sp. NPDC056185 TaxID=3345739 RepID=UPI0039EFF2EB
MRNVSNYYLRWKDRDMDKMVEYIKLIITKKLYGKQLDAIHDYMKEIELWSMSDKSGLPSKREDVDWQLFEPNVV